MVAAAAAAITVSTSLAGRRVDRPGPDPLAPGSAALSNARLADLLPGPRDFPDGWTIKESQEDFDYFGYFTAQPSGDGLGFTPGECFAVFVGVSTGDSTAVEISGHDPADPAVFSDRDDVRLRIGREYDPGGFDSMIALVSRCPRFTSNPGGHPQFTYTVRILEDSRPAGGPQRFRYVVTTQFGGPGDAPPSDDYFSYGRTAGLIVRGSGSDDHQQIFDTAFTKTLDRVHTARR